MLAKCEADREKRETRKSLDQLDPHQWRSFGSFLTRRRLIWSSHVAATSRRSFTVFSEKHASAPACHTDGVIQTAWCSTMPGIQLPRIFWKVTLARRRYRSGWVGQTRHSYSITHTQPSDRENKPGGHWKGLPDGKLRKSSNRQFPCPFESACRHHESGCALHSLHYQHFVDPTGHICGH